MNQGLLIISLLFSNLSYAETIKIKGKEYTLEEKKEVLNCKAFKIISLEKRLPYSVNVDRIPNGITMGHLGDENILSQTITYKSKIVSKAFPQLENLLSTYERIDLSRSYISRPVSCIGEDAVLFRMWGGGNCSTVCEAYVLITINENGEISNAKGLTYEEYNKY